MATANIQLLHAELLDHSYQKLELSGRVKSSNSTFSAEAMLLKSAAFGQRVAELILQKDHFAVWEFKVQMKKHSGLLKDGVVFAFEQGEIQTSAYKIGGEFGTVILGESLILPYYLYKQNMIYTGAAIFQPDKKISGVEIVILDKQHNPVFRQKAHFKETMPYNSLEIWEYSFESFGETDCLFYLKCYQSGSCLVENNLGEYYKLNIN